MLDTLNLFQLFWMGCVYACLLASVCVCVRSLFNYVCEYANAVQHVVPRFDYPIHIHIHLRLAHQPCNTIVYVGAAAPLTSIRLFMIQYIALDALALASTSTMQNVFDRKFYDFKLQ